jgi:hypothetical protein
MMSRGLLMWIVLAVGIAVASINIGLSSDTFDEKLAAAKSSQRLERERINVLRASYAHLTAIDQLKPLAELHLALKPIRGEQIALLQDLPRLAVDPDAPAKPPATGLQAVPAQKAPLTAKAQPSQRAEPRRPQVAPTEPGQNAQNPPWLKAQRNPLLQSARLPTSGNPIPLSPSRKR